MAKRYVMTAGGLKSLDFISFGTPLLPDNISASTGSALAVTCVGSTTPNNFSTPGAWVEIEPSLSADSSGVHVIIDSAVGAGATVTSTMLQIGTGAGGAETALSTFTVSNAGTINNLFVPGFIASGTRVSVRVFSAAESDKSVIARYAFASGSNISTPTTYNGSSPATAAQGVSVSTGSATEGAWTEISSSTSEDIDVAALFIGFAGDVGVSSSVFLQLDIGYGASSSEVAVAEHICYDLFNSETYRVRTPNAVLLPETIPAGSRLVVRAQVTSGASLPTIDVSLVTAYKP